MRVVSLGSSVQFLLGACISLGIFSVASAGDLEIIYRANDARFPFGKFIQNHDGAIIGASTWRDGVSGPFKSEIYMLSPANRKGRDWKKSRIVRIGTNNHEAGSIVGVVADKAGSMYGVYEIDIENSGYIIYKLSPNGKLDHLYRIGKYEWEKGSSLRRSLTLDRDGSIFGVFRAGGVPDCGVVFKLNKPGRSSEPWTYEKVHDFDKKSGCHPESSVVIDDSGDLFGITSSYPFPSVLYRIGKRNGEWKYTVLHEFDKDDDLVGDIAIDPLGAIVVAMVSAKKSACGAVFRLVRPAAEGGKWTSSALHRFGDGSVVDDGCGPTGIGPAEHGAFVGRTLGGGDDFEGVIFKLTPPSREEGPWKYEVLADLTEETSGFYIDPPLVARDGSLFGASEYGNVWRWKP
jgi:hypothetical protein